ncbi:hypothetical protein GAR05_06165 [Micromonospora saelicesensis]|uniref:Uncharacterized protein n=1 Tax=Micromonospora saelicesensis TaxID=285676 RepID=A0ABX9CAK7_9ACTN|nr:hypothetical protein [Micromonospora saelicesensis]RAN92673.1 hypothetical protein GAR05_06165 [Micromonospora saelicesensis]
MAKDPQKAAAIKEHKDARAELERVSRRDRAETDAFLDANDRVIAAEKNVPWYRR